jgi:aldehyde dehydrogenase (NAD+)
VCGGRIARESKYVEPTIILNPDRKSPIMEEEIFGPVLPILTFADF